MDTAEDGEGETTIVNAVDVLGMTLGTAADGVEIEAMAELAGGGTGTAALLGIGDDELGTPEEVGADGG